MDDLRESLGELRATIKAAHTRVDRLESGVREDLKDINLKLSSIQETLSHYRGVKSVWIYLMGLAATILGSVITYFLKGYGQ